MALTALAGELLPERTAHDAARTLAVRHAGHRGRAGRARADRRPPARRRDASARSERGVALVLDARAAPQQKLALAPALLAGVDDAGPARRAARARSTPSAAASRARSSPPTTSSASAPTRRSSRRSRTAFRVAFLVTGALRRCSRRCSSRPGPPRAARTGALVAAFCVAIGLPAAYAVLHRELAPKPVPILDPCTAKRKLPQTGGLGGFLQDQALRLLDSTACQLPRDPRGARPRADERRRRQALRAGARRRPAHDRRAAAHAPRRLIARAAARGRVRSVTGSGVVRRKRVHGRSRRERRGAAGVCATRRRSRPSTSATSTSCSASSPAARATPRPRPTSRPRPSPPR